MAKLNFTTINAAALASFETLVRQWLPGGTKSGSEYSVLNPTRADNKKGSFSINLNKGVWSDFSTGDSGGDPISLYAYLFTGGNQGEAAQALAAQLGVEPAKSTQAKKPETSEKALPRTEWRAIAPPTDAPGPPVAHIKRGRPERLWCYRSPAGAPLGYVYRFKTSDGGKEVLPLSWCRHDKTGAVEWRWMAFPEPRWLYGLDRLAQKPEAAVLVVEGEKCADTAAEQLPDLVCISWPGGGKAVDKCDWSPLAGRKVIIWPDCDAKREPLSRAEKEAGVLAESKPLLPENEQPGVSSAARVAEILSGLGSKVWTVQIPPPGGKPDGWDIADAIEGGLVGDELAQFIRGQVRVVAQAGFGESPPPADMPAEGFHRPYHPWEIGLITKPQGGLEECRENVFLILSRHPAWAGVIGFNEFTFRVEKRKAAPYGGTAGEWTASDDYETGLWLVQKCRLLVRSEGAIIAGVAMVADKNKFHPPRDWLESLPPWDGQERLRFYLTDTLSCLNSEYIQRVGTFFMIGIVARVFRPGCPMQHMPVLEGPQGSGKSSFWRVLGGQWYQETPFKLGEKEAYMQISGALVYEIAEMDSYNKAESTAVKAFITQQNDRYREPYGRRPVDRPRQCVFVGTTNHGEYLKDTTGNRRFWPVPANTVDLDYLASIREHLFAEALYRFKRGERWHPTREEENAFFAPEQDARRIIDPWLYPLQEWLDDVNQRLQNEFTTAEILCGAFKVELSKIDGNRGMATRVGNLMAELAGWTRKRRASGRREWVYVRPARTA
jgi:putative DNA primase/helicase